jgi:hypothetical protein
MNSRLIPELKNISVCKDDIKNILCGFYKHQASNMRSQFFRMQRELEIYKRAENKRIEYLESVGTDKFVEEDKLLVEDTIDTDSFFN